MTLSPADQYILDHNHAFDVIATAAAHAANAGMDPAIAVSYANQRDIYGTFFPPEMGGPPAMDPKLLTVIGSMHNPVTVNDDKNEAMALEIGARIATHVGETQLAADMNAMLSYLESVNGNMPLPQSVQDFLENLP